MSVYITCYRCKRLWNTAWSEACPTCGTAPEATS